MTSYKLKDPTIKAVFFSKDTVKETLEFLVANNIAFYAALDKLMINDISRRYDTWLVIPPTSKHTVISYTQQEMAGLAEPIKNTLKSIASNVLNTTDDYYNGYQSGWNECLEAKEQESGVFRTSEYNIPLVNVSYLEQPKNSSGKWVVMNGSTWNGEVGCYNNAPWLQGEDLEQFEKVWLGYISAQSNLLIPKK